MKQPVAYLRKSRVTSDRHVSWEVQLAAVNELAKRHGDPEPLLLSDWNKSGTKGTSGRPGFAQLVAMIEAGEVSTLYSYSLSRLSRSVVDYSHLAELCVAHGVRMRLAKEGESDFSTPSGRLIANILASVAQMEAELAQERAKDTVAVRRSRGDEIGGKPFANTDAVVQAYRDAGSFMGAAKLLTIQGVPTRNGNSLWQQTSVRTILMRAIPDEIQLGAQQGAKNTAPFFFYRLLRCQCGRLLTGTRALSGRNPGYANYRCLQGRVDPLHGPQSVPETTVLEWAMAEAALLSPPDNEIQMAEDAADKQKTLRDRKLRLGRAYTDGMVEEVDYLMEKEDIERELMALDSIGRVVKLEPISWDRDPKLVNQALRALWSHVQMDERQRPAFAAWTLPEWRATPEAEEGPRSPVAQVA